MKIISKLFKNLRYTSAGLGAVSSSCVVIYGALAGGIVYTIFGGITLIPSGMILFESKYFRQIEDKFNEFKEDIKYFEKEIDELDNHNKKLNNISLDLKVEIENYRLENKKLNQLFIKAAKNVESLKNVNDNLVDYKKELESNIATIKDQLIKTAAIKNKLENEIDNLEDQNEKLKNAVVSIQNLYMKSKELIEILVSTGSILSGIEDIDNNLENNVDRLSSLIDKVSEKLADSEFEKIDIDNNDLITKDEFENYIKKH